MTNLKD